MPEEVMLHPAAHAENSAQNSSAQINPQADITQAQNAQIAQDISSEKSAQVAPENQPPQEIVWPEDVSLSPQAQEDFLALTRELELPISTAQKLVDFEAGYMRAAQQAAQAQQEAWAEEIKQIYGPHWEEEVSRAVRAADVFGGPQLRALLEESGLGNHPVIVRTFNGIGKRISEDNTPLGQAAATGDKTFAEAMYGTLK